MKIAQSSVNTCIIYLSDTISLTAGKKVQELYVKLKKAKFIKDLIPSYTSILVEFDVMDEFESVKSKLEKLLSEDGLESKDGFRELKVPVYYGEEVGLDLEDVAKHAKLSVEEVIKIHTSTSYLVYAIGFLPGFAYMGEVDERIVTPRLSNPRAKIPRLSLGIADAQTAIYPRQSPGGWRILGKTYVELFDLNLKGYSFFEVGDRVSFESISKEEFLENGGEV